MREIMMPHMKSFVVGLGLAAVLSTSVAFAADPESCKTVRLSDVGWTDIQATTGVASVLLTALGYKPKVIQLSVPATFASLKNNDLDVFSAIGCRRWPMTSRTTAPMARSKPSARRAS